jgi:SOS-response transcriptional repressor LexA
MIYSELSIIYRMKTSDRVTLVREYAGMTKAGLARATGISKQGIGQLENGESKAPTPENLFKIARATRTSPEWIATGKGQMVLSSGGSQSLITIEQIVKDGIDIADPNAGADSANNLGIGTRRIPVVSNEEAIDWNSNEFDASSHHKWQECSSSAPRNAYGLVMIDDKMTAHSGRSIPSGAVVIIDPQRKPENGNVVAVSVGNEVIIKELVFDGANRYLRSFNQHYSPILINDDYDIIGTAIDFNITSSLL